MLAYLLHSRAYCATLSCTAGSPSRKRTRSTWPLGHFLAVTSAAYEGMSAPTGRSMQTRSGVAPVGAGWDVGMRPSCERLRDGPAQERPGGPPGDRVSAA